MQLKDVRRLFVEWSGQAHLMNEDGSDAGADDFLRSAADFLDEQVENPKSIARHIIQVVQGTYQAALPRCISILQVWIMGTIDGKTIRRQLEGPKSMQWLRENYDEPWDEQDQDTPEYFGLNVIGLDGTESAWTRSLGGELTGLADTEDIKIADHFEYNGLLYLPVSDGSYVMNVYGEFYQKKLALDTDINYWTIVKPHTLVAAACMIFERSMRNFEGVASWQQSVKMDLLGIDKVSAAGESAGINQMGG